MSFLVISASQEYFCSNGQTCPSDLVSRQLFNRLLSLNESRTILFPGANAFRGTLPQNHAHQVRGGGGGGGESLDFPLLNLPFETDRL